MSMNYQDETLFRFYCKSRSELFTFLENVNALGYIPQSVVSDEEYFIELQTQIDKGIDSGLIINFENGSHINLSQLLKNDKMYTLSFYFEWTAFVEEFILEFMANSNEIVYSYLTNYYDVKWQNETTIQAYKSNKREYKSMVLGYDIFGNQCIDISRNYGREIRFAGYLFIASYYSWFDVRFIERILNQNNLVFSSFVEKLELRNGLLRIKLFDNIRADFPSDRINQKKFIEDLGLLNNPVDLI